MVFKKKITSTPRHANPSRDASLGRRQDELVWGHESFGGQHRDGRHGRNLLDDVGIPSRKSTYPTWGKGKSSSKCHFLGGYVSSQEGISLLLQVGQYYIQYTLYLTTCNRYIEKCPTRYMFCASVICIPTTYTHAPCVIIYIYLSLCKKHSGAISNMPPVRDKHPKPYMISSNLKKTS